MAPINHGVFALAIKRRCPGVPLWALLVGVQFFDLLWIGFNLIGLERTATEQNVAAINDIHFVHMPFSHSVASTLVLAAITWFVVSRLLSKPILGGALAVAISSHLVLDILVHVPDIAIAPFADMPRIGSGLYGYPVAAFIVELIFAAAMWVYYRGSVKLLIGIAVVNLLAFTMFVPGLNGPEIFFSNAPGLFVLAISLLVLLSCVVLVWLTNPGHAD